MSSPFPTSRNKYIGRNLLALGIATTACCAIVMRVEAEELKKAGWPCLIGRQRWGVPLLGCFGPSSAGESDTA
jgi:hypothetical protein